MANPTTNYGFVLPTSSDLVTDLPADFDVALQGVDTRLKALQPGTTLGDLAYSSATANTNTRLAIGTTGQVLTVAGGVPSWATAPITGRVLQVVQAVSNTSTEIATSTFTDTSLTASITPTSASSKILVMVQQASRVARSSNENYAPLRLVRGSTVVFDTRGTTPVGFGGIAAGGNGLTTVQLTHFQPLIYLDSPATTSATTYKTQGNSYFTSDNGKVTYQWETMASTITLMEIGA